MCIEKKTMKETTLTLERLSNETPTKSYSEPLPALKTTALMAMPTSQAEIV